MDEHVEHRLLDLVGVDPLAHRQVALRVEVDAEDPVSRLGEGDREVEGRGRLRDAALLVGEADHLGAPVAPLVGAGAGPARGAADRLAGGDPQLLVGLGSGTRRGARRGGAAAARSATGAPRAARARAGAGGSGAASAARARRRGGSRRRRRRGAGSATARRGRRARVADRLGAARVAGAAPARLGHEGASARPRASARVGGAVCRQPSGSTVGHLRSAIRG